MTTSNSKSDLKLKTIHGTIELISREIGMKLIAIIGQLILVKLLEPKIFGIFAIFSFIIHTAEIFTDIGLTQSIIQKRNRPTELQLSTIFTVKLFLSIIIIIILNLCAPLLALVYPELYSDYKLTLFLLSITLLIRPLQTLSVSILERSLRYKEISIIDLSGMIGYYVTAITSALIGLQLYSFIFAVMAMAIIESVITFAYRPWVPPLNFKISSIQKYIQTGKFFQTSLYLTVIRNSIIPFVAGTQLSFNNIGLLDWSYNTSSFQRVFIDNLGRVTFSSFSRIQKNTHSITRSVEQAFAILSLGTLFIILMTIIFGYEGIHYIVNDKWLEAFPALCLYSASIFFLNGSGLYSNALLATGKIKEMVVSGAIVTFFEIIISYILLRKFGFVGIAAGFFLSSILVFSLAVFVCHKNDIKTKLTSILIKDLFIFIICLFFFILIKDLFPNTLFFFFFKILLASLTYLFVCILISKDELKLIINLVLKYLRWKFIKRVRI